MPALFAVLRRAGRISYTEGKQMAKRTHAKKHSTPAKRTPANRPEPVLIRKEKPAAAVDPERVQHYANVIRVFL